MTVVRVTLIHPDGRQKKINRGYAFQKVRQVSIPRNSAPQWECQGMEVVAALRNGKVVTAFEVDAFGPIVMGHHYPQRKYRTYRGSP